MIVTFCTFSRVYGPFFGKVVDAETGEPIEGAVVLIGIYTKSSSVGGWVWSFADAMETLTDSEGKFFIPSKRVNKFRGMSFWDRNCKITIFLPGYGAYPDHPEAYSSWKYKRSRYIPEKKQVSYYLPKLSTIEERKKNLSNILYPIGTPNEKMTNFRRLESEERVVVGLKP